MKKFKEWFKSIDVGSNSFACWVLAIIILIIYIVEATGVQIVL